MDVDELGVGERLQQQPDPACVGRRLQDQGPFVLPRQLPDQGNIRRLPPLDLLGGNIPEAQVATVMLGTLGKHPPEVRRAPGHQAKGTFLLGRAVGTQGHVVHAEACPRQQERSDRRHHPFRQQETVRHHNLGSSRVSEPSVHRQEVMEMGRAVSEMPEHEQRRLDGLCGNSAIIQPVFQPAERRVAQAAQGGRDRLRPAPRMNSEAVLPEQPHPVAKGDATSETGAELLQ